MALFDFLKSKQTAVQPVAEEARSATYGGPVVSNWDSAFGYGIDIDKLSVVYGCVNLRASTIASLPIQLNRKLEKGHEPATSHPYYNLITKRPNGFQTNYTFWHWVIVQLDLFGNAYIQKIYNGAGNVVELIPLNPSSVQIDIREDGLPFYTMYITSSDGKSYIKTFTNDQLIHIKAYSRNGIYGVSVIENFKTLLAGYGELETAGTQIAKNAAKPSGVVYHPGNIKEEELQKLKSGWSSGFNGTNSGKTAFLPNTLKVEGVPASLTAQEAEFISQKSFSATRIAADIFGVPLYRLGLTAAPVYASVEQSALDFVQGTLTPIITNIEQQIQKQLLDDDDEVYININVNGLLRGDIKTRIEWYRFALEHGVMTTQQVNEAEDTGIYIPPVNGGDDFIRPLNFSVIGKSATSGSILPT